MTVTLRTKHPVADFDRWRRDEPEAAAELSAQRGQLWDRVDVISDRRPWIVELVEEREPSHIPSGRSMD